MPLLMEVDRPKEYATASSPACQLRVEENDGSFKIQAGRNGSDSQTTSLLNEYEARKLYEVLRKRFGDACLACERQATSDAQIARLLGDHAGLLAIAQLAWPKLLAEVGSLRDTAQVVSELARLSDESEVVELAENWNLTIDV
jgi:hypothetical protein